MNLLQIAFWLLTMVAAGGLLMATMIAAKLQIPALLGKAHGLAALAALGVLFAANLRSDNLPTQAWWAFGVFFSGFLGGLLLFRVLFRDRTPLLLVAGHGSLGLIGLYLLYGVVY